jgi:hypothetical protein
VKELAPSLADTSTMMDGGDPWNPGDPRNKHQTRSMRAGIRQLLLEWDPLGVADDGDPLALVGQPDERA